MADQISIFDVFEEEKKAEKEAAFKEKDVLGLYFEGIVPEYALNPIETHGKGLGRDYMQSKEVKCWDVMMMALFKIEKSWDECGRLFKESRDQRKPVPMILYPWQLPEGFEFGPSDIKAIENSSVEFYTKSYTYRGRVLK